MKRFQKEVILDYTVQNIFEFFISSAKNSFPTFDEKNPVGCFSVQKGNKRFKAEIISYEKNRLYEIKLSNKREYSITRYEFQSINPISTKLIFTELESERNLIGKINAKLVYLLLGNQQLEEFDQFIKVMCKTLENKNNK